MARQLAIATLALIACLAIVSAAHAQTVPLNRAPVAPAPQMTFTPDAPSPSPIMTSLYAATILVQSLDAQSTFRALDNGARESNPLIGSMANSRPAFLALKAGIAAATIYAGHNLSKRHKVAAIAALVAVNTGYALIVRSNYHVASVMK